MNKHWMVMPGVALVLVGGWLVSQRRSLTTLEQGNARVRAQLQAVRGEGGNGAGTTADERKTPGKAKQNWKQAAMEVARMFAGDGGGFRVMSNFQKRLEGLSPAELLDALDELVAMDLTVDARNMLEQQLVEKLLAKDPELALRRLVGRVQEGRSGIVSTLAEGFGKWAKNDPVRASQWFDEQIAAGAFASKSLDGKSQARGQFERVLIGILLETDFKAAGLRLAALPADQRGEVIGNNPGMIKPANQAAYANLVREQVPAALQANVFAQQASKLALGGYAKVGEYFDRIGATAAERAACIEPVASTMIHGPTAGAASRKTFDDLRAWCGSQAPDVCDRVTGHMLGQVTYSNKMDFAAAAELAIGYGRASGNDAVLRNFLQSANVRSNSEAARELAGRIADEQVRAVILQNLKP